MELKTVVFTTISLVSYATTIVLKILTRRIESTAESYLGKDQFGSGLKTISRSAVARHSGYRDMPDPHQQAQSPTRDTFERSRSSGIGFRRVSQKI